MIVMNNYGSGSYIVHYTHENNTGIVIYQCSVIIIYYNNNIAKLTMYLIVTITTIILFANSKYLGFLSDIQFNQWCRI